MNARTRKLTALAMATALAVPALALAQDTTTEELDQLEQETAPPVSDIDDRMEPVDPEVDAMTQPPPQVDDTAADDADISAAEDPLQDADPMNDDNDRWAQLDSDGDGRISPEEGRVDADFSANFEMMDEDGDGFVSQAEFDAGAGVEPEEADDW